MSQSPDLTSTQTNPPSVGFLLPNVFCGFGKRNAEIERGAPLFFQPGMKRPQSMQRIQDETEALADEHFLHYPVPGMANLFSVR
tara:strand:- start:365 stop:616 length:252 start_codon:yes stop_codon:yes gene_type:complete